MTSRSRSASPNQPQAHKPLYTFEDYTTARGQRALAVRLDIRDMARLYAEHPRQAGGYESDWSTTSGSSHIPQAVHNADQALDALAAFQFPPDLKLASARAARDLAQAFEQVARLVPVRDLVAGRLDRRKLPDIARATAQGTFTVETVRPYRRMQPTPSVLPTVAVVASAGNAEMWNNADYIPRVLTLALSIVWACETAGLPVHAALVQSHCRLSLEQPYREAIAGYLLAGPGMTVSPRAYGVALHRDLWRYGLMTAQAADYAGSTRLAALEGKSAGPGSIGFSFPCRTGGAAAHWARQVLQADFVIAIGEVSDAADVNLSAQLSVSEAVQQIAARARAL